MVADIDKASGEEPVICRRTGRLGRVTLNRPSALNALTLDMITLATRTLREWLTDSAVELVVVDGAGERAFCAGGDITVVHGAAEGDQRIAKELWRAEYELDALLAHYPKPVAFLMDGIVMGGGLGLSGHHRGLRIVTERTVLAMPEVAIGLAPDVGGALLLTRTPGLLGTHLALTAGRIGPGDAIACGLADHAVDSSRLPEVLGALERGEPLSELTYPAASPLLGDGPWIQACYSAPTVTEIRKRLRARPEPAASEAANAVDSASPTALAVTLEALRRARTMTDIEECLVQDYRLCSRFLDSPDLAEGIRAAVIDKDRAPHWNPASHEEVSAEAVASYFEPLPEGELQLPPRPCGPTTR
ncbi:enoyl-CoA hydratase/isomerase family protein [Prauserella marina]|uniref:enoyl-CoA hydratase/isomerase family protein n=1 Tax=Prauserella marina TaxID=530584 RepID=UPI001FE8DDA5|nr:enoyl-CoA hydratase/isomerase family protein [Prauserella marina]